MDIEKVVTMFVETRLPRFSDDKMLLVMSFDLRIYRNGDYQHRQTRAVHLMFQRPNNYTKVFWNISRDWKRYYEYGEWNLTCDHDSGWRSDSISTPFFKLAQEMVKKINPALGCPDVTISINFRQEPKLVKVAKWKYEPNKRIVTVEFAKEEKRQ